MGVTCLIEVDDLRLQQQKSYEFEVCPRVGELIALPSRTPGYTAAYQVIAVEHFPNKVDQGKAAYTVLHIRVAPGDG